MVQDKGTTWPKPIDYVAGHPYLPEELSSEVLRDPNTDQPIQPLVESSAKRVEQALDCAWQNHRRQKWATLSPLQRSEYLNIIADNLSEQTDYIAQLSSRSTGLIISRTRRLASLLPFIFRAAAEQAILSQNTHLPGPHGAVEVHSSPLGPALCITPWNAPLAIAAHKVASALAAGCPVILKPSEWTPFVTDIIAHAIHKANLPLGTFQVVHGGAQVGSVLVSDHRIRAVSFTGGLIGGRAIGVTCAQQMKPAQLELGGNNPLVVLKGADLDHCARNIVTAMTEMNGQWCRALGRLLIQESIAAELLQRISKLLSILKIGHSYNEDSEMGPLIHRHHKAHIEQSVQALIQKGGTLLAPSQLPDLDGSFYRPSLILNCDPADTTEEIFGPVAAVHTFQSKAEALELVHQPNYGLAAYVFGMEEEALKFGRNIEAGMVKINGVTLTSLNPTAPRDAWRLSGLGVEGTKETYSFFTGYRVIGVAGKGEIQ